MSYGFAVSTAFFSTIGIWIAFIVFVVFSDHIFWAIRNGFKGLYLLLLSPILIVHYSASLVLDWWRGRTDSRLSSYRLLFEQMPWGTVALENMLKTLSARKHRRLRASVIYLCEMYHWVSQVTKLLDARIEKEGDNLECEKLMQRRRVLVEYQANIREVFGAFVGRVVGWDDDPRHMAESLVSQLQSVNAELESHRPLLSEPLRKPLLGVPPRPVLQTG